MHENKHQFVVSGVVAGIIIVAVLLVVLFSRGQSSPLTPKENDKNTPALENEVAAPPLTREAIYSSYKERVQSWITMAQEEQIAAADLLETLRADFLSVRVPLELRYAHLSSFLLIEQIRENLVSGSPERVRTQVTAELARLSFAVEAQASAFGSS